ncbi:hypothetical protein [Mesorhizobium sp. WSM2239]|uniref:Uncharacterized protein n=2 Tax=unclassified Mesorhizobium TaxID=325217 RepID=A0AAU8D3K4_9HYPH
MNTERQSNVIAAVFHNGYNASKRYHYFCKYPVRVGDHVIVDSPYSGYACVKVVDVLPNGSIKATKPVIQVVDDGDYRADIERQKRIAQIKAKLKARQAEIAELEFFRHLAKIDKESSALVAELEQLAA